MSMCKDVFNSAVDWCISNRSVSYFRCCEETYTVCRELYPELPSQYVQKSIRRGCAAVQAWNTKNQKAKWRYKGRRKADVLTLDARTLTIRGNLATISCVGKRVRTTVVVPQWFIDKYDIKPNNVQAGTLVHKDGRWTLNLTYRIPAIARTCGTDVVGVDRGLYNLVTLSTGVKYSSKRIIERKRRYQFQRSRLQSKGTRSARRRLKSVSGREKRFVRDANHCITKKMSKDTSVGTYVLEDLSGIRSQRRNKQMRTWLGGWSFYEFQTQLEYKCARVGIEVVYVDPRYTSQRCNACGKIDKNNRRKSRYVCSCGYTSHSDVNASLNIRDLHAHPRRWDRSLSTGQSTISQPEVAGCPSIRSPRGSGR